MSAKVTALTYVLNSPRKHMCLWVWEDRFLLQQLVLVLGYRGNIDMQAMVDYSTANPGLLVEGVDIRITNQDHPTFWCRLEDAANIINSMAGRHQPHCDAKPTVKRLKQLLQRHQVRELQNDLGDVMERVVDHPQAAAEIARAWPFACDIIKHFTFQNPVSKKRAVSLITQEDGDEEACAEQTYEEVDRTNDH